MKLVTYNRAIDKFLRDLDYICQENAVQIIFTNRNYVKLNGIKSSGYFDDEKRVLACCLKTANTEWLSTLVHESCHLDQWRAKSAIWQEFDKHPCNKNEWLDNWLNKKIELSQDQIAEMCDVTKRMEWDCECKSIEKIKQYKLKIELDRYLKQSVIYVMFYDFIAKHRKWYKAGKSPCIDEDIIAQIPDNYDLNILPILTPEIEELMKRCI